MASNFLSSTSLSSSDKEKIVRNMQEMFSHLDPEVIYIVLSECDFKVENAMDSLLELSVAAEDAGPLPSRVSGFELTAAALLNPHLSEPVPDPNPPEPSQLPSSRPPTSPLTEEFDLLIDQELETLTTQLGVKEELSSGQYLSVAAPLSSFPPPPVPQQVLPELLQSSLEPGARGPSVGQPCPGGALVERASGASSPLDQLSFWEEEDISGQQKVLDFTHLTAETPADKPKPSLDLGASGRPSAFQVYKKQDQPHTASERTRVVPSGGGIVGGARSKVSTASQEPLGNVTSCWNPEAPVFCPRNHGNQGPVFITPVALTPSAWDAPARHASHWLGQGPVSKAPLKPSATIPKSWAQPAAVRGPAPHSRLRVEGKVLVLLRGAPGSGKTTLARAMLEHNPGGAVLCTDDYFSRHGEYHFEPTALGEAHEWNHKRAKEAFESGANPIIIDNTNMQGWEMRPYVVQALKHKYKVLFREPDTWWKNKPRELERRTKHDVPVETIRRMLDGYERFVSVQSIIGSQPPEWKQRLWEENRHVHQLSSETPRPDLVGEPGLTEECKKSRPQLFSSLPDVSSVGRSGEMGTLEDSSPISTESLNLLPSKEVVENPEIPTEDDGMDLGALDSKLDAQVELHHPSGDQAIPDCIVESVLNEDHRGDEMPVAFSESIGQRVRRERRSRRSDFDQLEPADLVKDTNQSGREGEEKEGIQDEGAVGGEMVRDGGEKGRPELLDFVGDWPSDGGLQQRQVRRRERPREQNREEEGGMAKEADYQDSVKKVQPGPDVTEFQKLLDLIQTGVDAIQTGSSPESALSLGSGEESESEGEAGSTGQGSEGDRYSEESEQDMNRSDSGRAELPDCVLDWKAADSSVCREPPHLIPLGLGELQNGESSTIGGNNHMLEVGREMGCVGLETRNLSGSLAALSADSLVISEIAEAKVSQDRARSHNIGGEFGAEADAGHTDKDTHYCTDSGSLSEVSAEADGSHIGDVSQSPMCEGTEAESSLFSVGSQERKQRQGRRSGKQCKLALTFTQNCPSSSPKTLNDNTTAQNLISSQDGIKSDVELDSNPDWNPSVDPNFNLDLFPDPIPKPNPESLHSPISMVDTGCPTQTDPQDFALLWRLNRHDNPDDPLVIAGSHPGDITVLSGDPSRFMPELSCAVSAAVAVHPSGHREVPYRVVHEKGTQVEEKELGAARGRLESLRILSRHFKLVSFDTLEDLYDKCHQDLEWTTNLLLDSGERFFRDEDGGTEEEEGAGGEGDQNTSRLCGASGMAADTGLCPSMLDELHPKDRPQSGPAGVLEVTQESGTVDDSGESSDNTDLLSFGGALSQVTSTNKDHPDETLHLLKSPQPPLSPLRAVKEGEGCEDAEQQVTSRTVSKESERVCIAYRGWSDDGVLVEETQEENGEDEMSSMDEITRLLLEEIEEIERGEQKKEGRKERRDWEERRSRHLDIQSVELKLPTELALQLTELFGPVGIDPGACSTDDYAVQMDLNLAKQLHQKWKDTIQERQRQAALSYHLLQESSVHWGESQVAKTGPWEGTQPAHFLIGADGYASLGSQSQAQDEMPFMDHWSASRPHVSLRDIMTEEQARQQNMEKTRQSRADLDRRDGATLLKENQLYSLFPTIDRHFLQDIFRDHNYCLMQTELFLRSLLDEGPVKTVVAPEPPRSNHHRAPSKERDKRLKPLESILSHYQDMEDPEYDDFRAEASLQRSRQIESFTKAAEAFKQGRKDVASFYAQQGHLHGQRMREANHRAAVQIFEQVNSSLLPRNILDLHGLHVDEALQHLAQVLQDKTTEYEQGLCRPQLSVITGRGNHSQGGVARIRPAVIDYLTNKHYRFTEPKPGLVLVSLN
ncbi:NEDD4-binding protein 2 [Centroberyx affinis]|uniref:NEDD4-binding protein 2 n=1 Tax=Centroberyx affinis TaxID=166261 RepID=UPI003A5C1466